MLRKAIVREPGSNFATGLTSVDLGAPVIERAVKQHRAYCRTLESCGLELVHLPVDEQYPDSTFVEDTAVLTARGAIVTRPGASSRLGEVEKIIPVLKSRFDSVHAIEQPGTLDGGDICEAGEHFFIGLSRRTNLAGAQQLARVLQSFGYTSSLIDIRGLSSILHLKSGLAYLGSRRLVVIEALQGLPEFSGYDLIGVNSHEEYAANCLAINGKLLVGAGFPAFQQKLDSLGYETIALEMSEFQKMDGGLSCLSLRL